MALPIAPKTANTFSLAASLTAALLLGACAQGNEDALQSSLFAAPEKKVASAEPEVVKTELEKATEYWGKKYKEHPTDLEAALSYTKNLKAMGERQQALAVVQNAANFHGSDKQLASEYGRLALELDQLSVAKQMLAVADDPANPDWRVLSARGTVAAKEGQFREAIPLYERALMLSQEQTSVMNNLAMAYAMSGDAARAEDLLRKIEAKGGNAKTRQNLALVLGLQGKFDEQKRVASQDLGSENAANDTATLKRMVKVEKPAQWSAAVASDDKPKATKAAAKGDALEIKPAVADAARSDDAASSKVAGIAPNGSPWKGMASQ